MRRILTTLSLLLACSVTAQDRFADVQVKSTQMTESVYMLEGAGGNIGVSVGDDGVLIVDDQFAELGPKIIAAIRGISESKIRYVVNTHYHGDHTGANAFLKRVEDATVFAHDNVRNRLEAKENVDPDELPVVTYEQGVKFHFNGDTIHVRHRPHSHTDGDSYVLFENQNIIHAGDLLFNMMFPYIDLDGGGSVEGYINTMQAMIDASNSGTRIIAGHGVIASRDDLETNLNMLKTTASMVKSMKDAGLSLEQALEEGLGEEWASWSWRFITTERWITTLYNGQ